jgi:hypothetical protein
VGTVPTKRIKHGKGFAVINVSDFDPATMEEYVEAAPKPKPKATRKAPAKRTAKK